MNGNYDIAVYGLGVMGRSLAQNMIGQGIKVCAYSKDQRERQQFGDRTGVLTVESAADMVAALKPPRKIFLMITAGPAVDSVLEELLPLLENGDTVIDGGNSHYEDTARRCRLCENRGRNFVGIGVSGGEQGALNGPSMMAGGSREGFEQCREILEKIAAASESVSCCAYIGPEGAGHYVKMVHNGIEYAMLQVIAEIYYFIRYGLKYTAEETVTMFESFKGAGADSYLIDISVQVLKKKDQDGRPLVEKILDVAGQKGTGRWTLEEGVRRAVYIPTIYEAVSARSFSGQQEQRRWGNQVLGTEYGEINLETPQQILSKALTFGMLACYSQGFELIRKASDDLQWDIKMDCLPDVWQDGCIIRSSMLDKMRPLLKETHPVVLNSFVSEEEETALRTCVAAALEARIAVPALASVLHYYDYYRMERMPIGFIQGLRDCFGAHTYKRIDQPGDFHTNWEESEEQDELI